MSLPLHCATAQCPCQYIQNYLSFKKNRSSRPCWKMPSFGFQWKFFFSLLNWQFVLQVGLCLFFFFNFFLLPFVDDYINSKWKNLSAEQFCNKTILYSFTSANSPIPSKKIVLALVDSTLVHFLKNIYIKLPSLIKIKQFAVRFFNIHYQNAFLSICALCVWLSLLTFSC
jgi:UDP-N-acetylmuramyl pentapeptide phosphotransferase/UDP-N-acetylglucosamine-1-phosphate transferase